MTDFRKHGLPAVLALFALASPCRPLNRRRPTPPLPSQAATHSGTWTNTEENMRAARAALIALVAGASLTAPASALECPAPQPVAKPGVLQETPAQVKATGKVLSSGDVGQQTQAIIADLRKRYPQAENAELANYLITAYCPVVAGLPQLGEAEKKARMDQFVSQLMQKIY